MHKKRKCGSCTACCKTHPIFRIEKLGGVWCEHCDIGHHCRIHTRRPEECRDFECQWLKDFGTEADRPDKTKIVVDYCRPEDIDFLIVSLWEVSEGALLKNYAQSLRQQFLDKKMPVLAVALSGKSELHIPISMNLSEREKETLRNKNVTIV